MIEEAGPYRDGILVRFRAIPVRASSIYDDVVNRSVLYACEEHRPYHQERPPSYRSHTLRKQHPEYVKNASIHSLLQVNTTETAAPRTRKGGLHIMIASHANHIINYHVLHVFLLPPWLPHRSPISWTA